MPLNVISHGELLQIFAEAHGDREKAFDEVERRQRAGLTRYYFACCNTCHGLERNVNVKFDDFDKRNDYAAKHSELKTEASFTKEDGTVSSIEYGHTVQIWDDWL